MATHPPPAGREAFSGARDERAARELVDEVFLAKHAFGFINKTRQKHGA